MTFLKTFYYFSMNNSEAFYKGILEKYFKTSVSTVAVVGVRKGIFK